MKSLHAGVATVCACLLSFASVSAAVIDFETTPAGGTPVDDAALSSPYNLVGGGTVTFFSITT